MKHGQNSEINYITVMDLKKVLIVSIAAGVTPLLTLKFQEFETVRILKTQKKTTKFGPKNSERQRDPL